MRHWTKDMVCGNFAQESKKITFWGAQSIFSKSMWLKSSQFQLTMISNKGVVGHGDSPDVAKELRDMVAARFPEAEIFIAPIGPIIGAHAGPGVMTVFFWGNNH